MVANGILASAPSPTPSSNVLTRWIEKTPLSIDNYPALKAHRAHMEADEGVKQSLARQAMEPIG